MNINTDVIKREIKNAVRSINNNSYMVEIRPTVAQFQLPNGKKCQVQIVITTNKKEFTESVVNP